MVSFGVYLAMFALTFNAAYGIRCYSCDSTKDMTCSFGFLSLTLPSVECSQSDSSFLSSLGSLIPSQCMKLVGVDRAGNEYIARGCTVNTGPVNACQLMAQAIKFGDSKDIQSLDCWTCTTDQCNSGSRFSAVAIVVGVVTACVAFLF